MSRRFYTADWHLNHENIIRYCNRPFSSVEKMAKHIIGEANMRAGTEDWLFHVGDFSTHGNARGVPGLKISWHEHAALVKARLVLLKGNHDKNNKVKTACDFVLTSMAGIPVFIGHYPTDNEEKYTPELRAFIRGNCKFAVVGHVHTLWKTKCYPGGFMDINVGVDAHQFRPVSEDELVGIYRKGG